MKKKNLVILLLALVLTLGLAPAAWADTAEEGGLTVENVNSVFADIHPGDWCAAAVVYVYNDGMMTGTEKGFDPNALTTRGMLVTMLYRLEGSPETEPVTFTDVHDGDWYGSAVFWASRQGVVQGYKDGSFNPNGPVTREELAMLLFRYAGTKDANTAIRGSLAKFRDNGAVSGWASEAVQWAVGAEIMSGDSEGILKPAGRATRAEVATMLMRFCENTKIKTY